MLKINKLHLEDFRGYKVADFEFEDFSCLFGPNGIGKTSILEAICLLCSSLDFGKDETSEVRMQSFLRKNIRNIDEPLCKNKFLVSGEFVNDGEKLEVILTNKGFVKNEILSKPWWWHGITYFAKFDIDMVNFQLPMNLWPSFSSAYENITGIKVDPEEYTIEIDNEFETDIYGHIGNENGKKYAVGFWMEKDGDRIHSRKASAGEKKIAKSLSQIVSLPVERMPHIVLVDNIEMHIYYKRHLIALEEIKKIFTGRQLVTTTHSTVIIDKYEQQSHLINLEDNKH